MVGGNLVGYGTNAFIGDGPHFVAEADESDGSLLAYVPKHAVITSVDDDVNVTSSAYSDCGYSRSKVQATVNELFLQFARKTEQGLWICFDHARCHRLLGSLPKVRTYGSGGTCTLRAEPLERGPFHTRSLRYWNGKALGELRVPMPGHHNVLNALGTVGIALDLGLSFPDIAHSVAMFRGVRRRFERIGKRGGRVCIDDYAHNPQKIVAALQASIQACRGRVVALFQPHRYTRMKLLEGAFLPVLDGADEVILTDVFAAGEEPNGFDIEGFREKLAARAPRDTVHWAPDEGAVHQALDRFTRPGDLVISLGAGSCGQWLRNWVKQGEGP
jgi:UDP-N-acetylmuramate--alanine ligase